MPATQEQQQILSAFGLQPQAFPLYYPMGAQQFLDAAGQPSGSAGAAIRFGRALSNFPHMLIGLRISNEYPYPDPDEPLTEAQTIQYQSYKKYVDQQQMVSINLSQQNIIVDEMIQSHLTGAQGIHWHPFPTPFPMAGGNSIVVNVRRLTGYPDIGSTEIIPSCHVTLVTQVLRADLKTVPVRRAQSYEAGS